MKLRIDYTAGNIFDLANHNFKFNGNDHATAWNIAQAKEEIFNICRWTEAQPEDFLITNLANGKTTRIRRRG